MFMRAPTDHPRPECDASSSSETLANPANTPCSGERRDHARLVCGGPVWWKNSKWDTFAQGWLLERSPDGIAYLTRGSLTVVEGQLWILRGNLGGAYRRGCLSQRLSRWTERSSSGLLPRPYHGRWKLAGSLVSGSIGFAGTGARPEWLRGRRAA